MHSYDDDDKLDRAVAKTFRRMRIEKKLTPKRISREICILIVVS